MKQLTVRQSEQKQRMFMRKNTESLRIKTQLIDILKTKTYTIHTVYEYAAM